MSQKLPTPTSTAGNKPPFLVGIAGTSSSGKTVLSLILSEIFKAAMDQGQQGNTSASMSSIDTASTITTISQNDYFIAESNCPRTTFRPRSGDETVVAGYVGPDGRVETADIDCLAAVDWVRLLEDLDAFLAGQKQQQGGAPEAVPNATSAHQTELACYRTNLDSFVAPELRKRMVADIRACIDEQVMFNSFDKFEGKLFKKDPHGTALLNCRLGFVEGFLLYVREPPLPRSKIPQTRQGDGDDDASSSSSTSSSTSSNQQQQQQPPEPHMQPDMKTSQGAVRDRFHNRLYIHIPTEMAYQRRFSRTPFIDQPQGQRMPGQMWKTKGYYFDVARANFYKFDLADCSLATQLWQGQEIIKNAVHSILETMKEYEVGARAAALETAEKEEEEAMARVKGETNTFW